MSNLVDKAILSMNRAAEDAAKVGNIFWNSIKQMSITDGLQILKEVIPPPPLILKNNYNRTDQ